MGSGPQELEVAGRKPRPSAPQPLSLQDTVLQVKAALLMACQSTYLQGKETSCKHSMLSLSGGEHQTELWEPMDTLDKIQAVFGVIWHKLLQELKHSWIIFLTEGNTICGAKPLFPPQ